MPAFREVDDPKMGQISSRACGATRPAAPQFQIGKKLSQRRAQNGYIGPPETSGSTSREARTAPLCTVTRATPVSAESVSRRPVCRFHDMFGAKLAMTAMRT